MMHSVYKHFYTFMRFNFVGVVATICYFCIGLVLNHFLVIDTFSVHLIAFSASIVVSYLGHAYFTFAAAGRKALWRFAITTAFLLSITSILSAILENAGAAASMNVLAVTIAYPIGSFILHSLWTFRR